MQKFERVGKNRFRYDKWGSQKAKIRSEIIDNFMFVNVEECLAEAVLSIFWRRDIQFYK